MCRPSNSINEVRLSSTSAKEKPKSIGANTNHDYCPRHFYFKKEKASAPYLTPLNDKVEAIAARHVEEAAAAAAAASRQQHDVSSIPLPPHILLHADGAFVYPRRYRGLPIVFFIAACWLVTLCPSRLALCLATVILYFESDLYSGVLHIVLDDPKNLGRSNYLLEAIMFQGCLEFQWHHEIPRDIVHKGLLSSCADLNVVVIANMCAIALVHGLPTNEENHLLWSLLGFKLLYGYFGQLNHLMAHTSTKERPAIIRALQRWTFMLDHKKHNGHHRTYDENFCLLGHMDWAVHFIDGCIPQLLSEQRNYIWFAIWMLISIFCLPCIIAPCIRFITEIM